MRMYDIIQKKRDGYALSDEEIKFFIDGYTDGSIPDYQASAFTMAVYFKGMTDAETVALTLAMAHSGDMVDLSCIHGVTCDKHSTGGVGDKTTLIVAPIVASLGGVIAKMSGRGLGHTGGTVDKLESIPGFRTELSPAEFLRCAQKNGICVVGQSGNLAPADKKLYALRDVTATVDSIPLIASSIMSKKLAAGASCITLDVKVGSGAFMKDIASARKLAETMVAIGRGAGRKVAAVLTNMDIPLGYAVGNSLEVIEAVKVLRGEGPEDLREVSLTLASVLLHLATGKSQEECFKDAEKAISDGSALEALCGMVASQGGDVSYIRNTEKFKLSKYKTEITAEKTGYISGMITDRIGTASVLLGAGREKKGDAIDYGAGIILCKKTGDFVNRGDVLCEMYTEHPEMTAEAEKMFNGALIYSDGKILPDKLIYEIIK